MSAIQHQGDVLREAATMVRDYLFQNLFRHYSDEQLQEITRHSHKAISAIRHGSATMWDLMDLLEGAGIDIGLTIRTRDGEKVTFFPGVNFGPMSSGAGDGQEKKVAKKSFDTTPTAIPRSDNSNQGGKGPK
jgi:hypothetical protein